MNYTLTRQPPRHPSDVSGSWNDSVVYLSVDGTTRPPFLVHGDVAESRVPPHFIRALEDYINHLQFDFLPTAELCHAVLFRKRAAVDKSRFDSVVAQHPDQLVLDGV